jgi:hypothetical protein
MTCRQVRALFDVALAFAIASLLASSADASAAQGVARHITQRAAQPPGRADRQASLRLVFRQEFLARLPYDNTLISVEATSRSDAWAVGGTAVADHNLPDYAVHWNGKRWRIVHLPDPKFVPVSVRASSRHDVWIFGWTPASGAAEALRWDGAQWHVMTVPPLAQMARPVVLSPSDVWLGGGIRTAAGRWSTRTWHWNGQAWTSYDLPIQPDWLGDFIIAGSSDRNLWAVGALTSSRRHGVGRLAAYRWNGTAWQPMPVPRLFLIRPQVAVSASGEVWIAGKGPHAEPAVLYRTRGTWSRLPDRVLDKSLDAVFNPIPDGLNGVWFEFGLYWDGHAAVAIPVSPAACNGGFYTGSDLSFMAGIPRTHWVLTAGGCQLSTHGKIQGEISLTRPR